MTGRFLSLVLAVTQTAAMFLETSGKYGRRKLKG
jgi:hypothetical protein